ncbi:Uncharacterised protein [Mycobacterium tuberculosis]|nr:Uncharacterised protein [Mycobacterium tuberculosis]
MRLFLDDVEQALPGEIGRHTFGLASERCTAVCMSARLISTNASFTPRLG